MTCLHSGEGENTISFKHLADTVGVKLACKLRKHVSDSVFSLLAPGLRTPLAVPCSYPGPFGMVPHPGMNGELSGVGAAYTGLHNISPQMSAVAAAAVAAYGRTQVVPQHSRTH